MFILTCLRKATASRAIHDAMIVREGDIHHGSNHDLSVASHRSVLNRMEPEDAALRRVDDRSREQRAVDAPVRDRKGASFEVFDRQLLGLRALREIDDCSLDFRKAQTFGIS